MEEADEKKGKRNIEIIVSRKVERI